MHVEHYTYFVSDDFQNYSFYSEGPKGKIKKTVIYSKIQEEPIVYNLAFGDEDPVTGEISDTIISNNNDRDIVLATVANTINTFSKRYGNHLIYATGSTSSRTRLYQMSISKLFDDISLNFDIFGVIKNEAYPFISNVNYDGFLVKKK